MGGSLGEWKRGLEVWIAVVLLSFIYGDRANRGVRGRFFFFTVERIGILRLLWLVGSQVPGSIFPCGKNLHPAA